jgi:hypothetical protein
VHDPEWFRRDVLARLVSVKLSEIAEAGPASASSGSTSNDPMRSLGCGGTVLLGWHATGTSRALRL